MRTQSLDLVKSGDFNVIGKRPVRHDGVDKVTGRAAYGADIALPGMLHGKVLRSPHAHAEIVSIDTSRAEALPGVHAVVTYKDLPEPSEGTTELNESGVQDTYYKAYNMLAREKVLYDGHAIATVAATDPHVAEQAARLIDVEYKPMPPVMTCQQATAPGAVLVLPDIFTDTEGEIDAEPSNITKHTIFEEGDLEAGFAAADVEVEAEYNTATVHQGYIETHNATARWHEDGTLEVWCSSQGQFGIRQELADLLRMPVSKIKVTPMEIGGGFGGKTTVYLEILAALLSQKTGRPVKMTMDRTEVLKATGPTPGTWEKVRIGAGKDGKITAVHVTLYFEAGGVPGSPLGAGVMTALGPYSLTNFRIDGYEVLVNKPHSHAYRAPGATMSEFAVETAVDEVCEKLGMDPMEFRLLNASREGDLRAEGPPFLKIGNVECLENIKNSDHWQTPLEQPKEPHLKRGRGLASGFWMNGGGKSSAQGRVNPDGTVTLLEGSVDIGGTRTSVAMQMAEVLGIPIEDINPIVPDTDSINFTGVTGGSRVTYATGYAAYEAARDIVRQMIDGMADVWEVDPAEVEFDDAVFSTNGQTATFKEAAALLDEEDSGILGTATVSPSRAGNTFSVQAADVEVDTETGKVQVLRYTGTQDAGVAIYPPYVEGQLQGGIVQGIGWALNEEYFYDSEGRLRNASLLDYRMPTSLDLPMIDTIITEVPNPGHPYGVRGVGEVSIAPPPATIANAIHDAIKVRMRDLPMSPPRVQKAISENAVN